MDLAHLLDPSLVFFLDAASRHQTVEKLAEENGIETMEACTLVLLSTGQY